MKAINKILTLSATALTLVGCNDLDTEPMGSVVTSEQKQEIIANDPSRIEAAVSTVPGMMKMILNSGFGNIHTDYGVPSLALIYDSRGMDMPSALGDYQWYTAALEWSDFGDRYYDNLITWNTMYNLIYSCNELAKVIDPETENAELQASLAQALAFRGYAYYVLAQMYQFTYYGNEDQPVVPIITHVNAAKVAEEGAPRATQEEMYAQITQDFTDAITLLEKSEAQNLVRADKSRVNAAVAYGLRARAYMMMHKWAECAADAQKAINLATAEGLSPYTRQEVSVPSFNSWDSHAWMWGIDVNENEIGTASTVSFTGHMGCWLYNGYARYGHWRCINKKLYKTIPDSDVRKSWWLNGTNIPSTLPGPYKEYITNHAANGVAALSPYAQLKFGAHNNEVGGTDAAYNFPLMRVEEMYLMLAEAQGMQNPGQGLQTLTTFVKAYRNPDYMFSTASAEDLQEEIWMQRRVELWGEGFSYFDMMRLNKVCDRRGGGFDPSLVYVVAPDDLARIFVIPQTEQKANPQIGYLTSLGEIPTAVPDID